MLAHLRSPLVLSLTDQVVVSAASLALSFWLISRWPPEAFGVFAIVNSIALAGLAAHQALAGAQLPLMLSHASGGAERSEVLATAWIIALAVALAVGTATALGFYVVGEGEGPAVPLLAGLFVLLNVCREHVRIYHFAVFEVGHALVNDLVQVGLLLAVISAAVAMGWTVNLTLVLAALVLSSAVAPLPTLLARPHDFVVRLGEDVRARARTLWQEHSRWALMGASASEMQSRGHVAAVSMFFSVADLGIIQAALMLLRPINLLLVAWSRVARPVMAGLFAENRVAAAARYGHISALGFAVTTVCYLAVLWVAWPFLAAHVLPPDYRGLQAVVPLWGIATILGVVRAIYSIEAQCVPIFREAFFASAVAMTVVCLGLGVAVLYGTANSTVLAIAAGESAALVMLLCILHRRLAGRDGTGPTQQAGLL